MTDKPLILLVEDDMNLREAYVRLLQREGYEVNETDNVISGLRACDMATPVAVVHDVNLGWGGKLTDEVVESYRLRKVPVIAFTGDPLSAPDSADYIYSKANLVGLLDLLKKIISEGVMPNVAEV